MVWRKLSSKFNVLAALALGGAALGAACSASNGGSEFSGGTGGSNSTGSNAGGNHSTGADVGGGSFVASSGSNGSNGSAGVGGGCVGVGSTAQQIPLDIAIMLDQSGSMSDPVSGGGTKWTAVTSALTSYVNQPNQNGVSVGLGYFGVPPGGGGVCGTVCQTDADCGPAACGPCFIGICLGGGGAGDSCDANDYAKFEVPIQPLPGVASVITSSLGKHMPSTSTPTSAALQGAIQYATGWEKAHATHKTIVVFATDGDPSECDTNLANIDAIAAAGLAANPSILTFVIGVGPSLQALDGIAAAGGTMTAFHVDTNGNANQQFLDAMNKIRGSVLSCAYLIPPPPMGMMLDYNQVNVEYTPGGGGQPVIVPKVQDKASCPANGLAWYYDNNAMPTQILLCDATCNQISMDANANVKVILGCGTVVK